MVGTPEADRVPGRPAPIRPETPDLLVDLWDIFVRLFEVRTYEPLEVKLVNLLAEYGWQIVRLEDRRAPVQRDGQQPAGTIPWSTHLLAWQGYADAGHGGPTGQSAERIAERGGFGYREVQCAIAGHYNRTGRCGETHPEPPGWKPRS